jgi:hypothetical protein
MQAEQVLHKVLRLSAPAMHRTRRESLEANVMAALTGQSLTVTHLGRSMRSAAKEKHCIKRADRLLSNHRLHAEREALYGAMCRSLLGSMGRAMVLVDWSDLDQNRRHFLLRASLSMPGRSLTLYEEVHTLKTKDKAATHRQFLRRFHAMVPAQCRPIIVTDAGFRVPWFEQVEALGWDWISRVRARNWVELDGDGWWWDCRSLHDKATATPKALGEAKLTWKNAWPCRLVLYKGKAKGRVHLTQHANQALSRKSLHHAKSAREPWLLATSLPLESKLAKRVVRLYRQRMQIEEAFRDLKCARFGLALERHVSFQPRRLAVLLLIAMLALLVAWLMGKAVELTKQHMAYQANTVRHRLVLSTIFLGLRVVHDRRVVLSASDMRDAFEYLRQQIQHLHSDA